MGIYKDKKIGVLMGGLSKEREISLRTGRAVAEALRKKRYAVVEIDCGREVSDQLRKTGVQVVFIALHGVFGEDGTIQGILEWLRIPYTGSGVLASALAMDKAVLNQWIASYEIPIPREVVFNALEQSPDDFIKQFKNPLPVVVKPSREGSTLNVSIVREPDELKGALLQALASDTKVLVEEFVAGQELTVAVLNGKTLPVIEIAPKSGFYDYQAKYTKGATDYFLPARISSVSEKRVRDISEKLYRSLDCSGVIRADFILQEKTNIPYFLEVNTLPGMTETSLVPKAAAYAGISFEDLVETILSGADLKLGLGKAA